MAKLYAFESPKRAAPVIEPPTFRDPWWDSLLWEPPKRLIRSFKAHAKETYECWDCSRSHNIRCQMEATIYAGDPYCGEVYVDRYHWTVRRFHDFCPDPILDDYYNSLEEDEAAETEKEAHEELPLAA